MQYNYNGVKGKKEFKKLENINNVIFGEFEKYNKNKSQHSISVFVFFSTASLEKEGYTKRDYEEDIRTSFKMIKNRFF